MNAVLKADSLLHIAKNRKNIVITEKDGDIANKEIDEIKQQVLIVDDSKINREILAEMLNDDFRIIEATDGVEGIEKIEQYGTGIAIVLLDIVMPNMDGYKAAQYIRHLNDKKKAEIPIIAMTANAFEEDRKKALAKGMNVHIAKPVDAEKVEKTICGVLSRRSEQ